MFRKKISRARKYNDGDIIEFNFRPNSLDINGNDVVLIGIITGVLYENDGNRYRVQMMDDEREIFGDFIIPENIINRKMAE